MFNFNTSKRVQNQVFFIKNSQLYCEFSTILELGNTTSMKKNRLNSTTKAATSLSMHKPQHLPRHDGGSVIDSHTELQLYEADD